jgi:hypothetical protein
VNSYPFRLQKRLPLELKKALRLLELNPIHFNHLYIYKHQLLQLHLIGANGETKNGWPVRKTVIAACNRSIKFSEVPGAAIGAKFRLTSIGTKIMDYASRCPNFNSRYPFLNLTERLFKKEKDNGNKCEFIGALRAVLRGMRCLLRHPV